MTWPQKGVVVAASLTAALIGWVALTPDTPAPQEPRALSTLEAPETPGGTLRAEIIAPPGRSSRSARSEVEVKGSLSGKELDETVFGSQDPPDMLRLGWASPDHLVISVPQYPEDVGKALGAGDPSFHCASRPGSVLRVECEAYAIGPRR